MNIAGVGERGRRKEGGKRVREGGGRKGKDTKEKQRTLTGI